MPPREQRGCAERSQRRLGTELAAAGEMGSAIGQMGVQISTPAIRQLCILADYM